MAMQGITVLLDRKELVVTMDSKTIKVAMPDGTFKRFPLVIISRIIVIGRPLVSCDVWRAASSYNIPVLLLSGRGSEQAAHIGPLNSEDIAVRAAQFKLLESPDASMSFARWVIRKKISGQKNLLQRYAATSKTVNSSIQQLERALQRMEEAKDRNSMMGVEGAAAATYFEVLGHFLHDQWGFKGRNRRPPRDPVNALLSLCYTLAMAEIRSAILIAGLEPVIGFLHTMQHGREGLVLDLLEIFRPDLDSFVLQMLKKLTTDDFITNKQDGCRLQKKSRAIFFEDWLAFLDEKTLNCNGEAQTVPHKIVNDYVVMLKAFASATSNQ